MQKTITIELPESLLQPLVGLIDAGIRSSGLRSIREAARIVEAIEVGVSASSQSEAQGVENGL